MGFRRADSCGVDFLVGLDGLGQLETDGLQGFEVKGFSEVLDIMLDRADALLDRVDAVLL